MRISTKHILLSCLIKLAIAVVAIPLSFSVHAAKLAGPITVYLGTTNSASPPASFTSYVVSGPSITYNTNDLSYSKPFNASSKSAFDQLVHYFIYNYYQVTIVIRTGDYETDGIGPFSWDGADSAWIEISGDTNGPTKITLADNAPASADGGGGRMTKTAINMIGSHITIFELYNLEVDCNWSGQSSYNTICFTDGYRLNGVRAICDRGAVVGVTLKNFGSNSSCPLSGNGAEEAFGIVLSATEASGNSNNAHDPNGTHAIDECVVEDFHRIRMGYCTAILIGNRGNRSSLSATMWNNEVNNIPNGIAYGVARAQHVSIRYNTCNSVGMAFNADTPLCDEIELSNNIFSNCDYGISVGSIGGFSNFSFFDNEIQVVGPGAYCANRPYTWGYRFAGGISNIVIDSWWAPDLSSASAPKWEVALVSGASLTGTQDYGGFDTEVVAADPSEEPECVADDCEEAAGACE